MIELAITSDLKAGREEVWRWMTSVEGISAEMWPYFRMTAPPGVHRLDDLKVELGKPLFRSRVFLFGFIPAGHWDFTLVELADREGFVEQSASSLMESWRHERRIRGHPGDASASVLSDRVTFVPRGGDRLVGPFLRKVFAHRHALLRKRFGVSREIGAPPP